MADDAAGGSIGAELGRDGVLRLTLSRPSRHNALTDEMVAVLITSLEAAEHDDAVRAVLLSGDGPDFCSGFDLAGRSGAPGGDKPRTGSIQRRVAGGAHRLILTLARVQVPIVAAVRGWASGLGLHLALAADFCVSADDARLWEPFSARGFTPDSGATWLLLRRGGEVLARDMLLLGREVSGAEAAGLGLVHRAVPAGELDDTAEELVIQIASGPTVALGLTKVLLHRAATAELEAHLVDEAWALELSSRSPDFREGMAAFRDRRPAHFGGR